MNAPRSLADFLVTAARRRAASGDTAGAATLLDEALVQDPRHAVAAGLLADMLVASDPPRAAAIARALLADRPDDAATLDTLARAASALGDTAETVAVFRYLAAQRPGDAGLHANLSLALLRLGLPHEAAAAARHAIACDPGLVEAHANLGHALNALRDGDAALDAFRAALTLRPEYPDALLGVARVQLDRGQPAAAVLALRRAEAGAPGLATVQTDLAAALQVLGAHQDSMAAHRRAMALDPAMAAYGSNLLMAMQYVPEVTTPEAVAEAQAWGLRQSLVPRAGSATLDRDPERPLRIGYVSADFGRHPVGWLGGRVIGRHTRPAFTVFAYANQAHTDWVTETIAGAVDRWCPILGLSDDVVARRIIEDRIDILVDLSGHTGGHRLGVFARRAAPVQLSWLGYFATTGLPAMDAVLLDQEHAPEGAEAQFTEQIVRLPMGRFCYMPPPDSPDPMPPPSDRAGYVTFGSFNNAAKLNDETLDLWARVLHAVPCSRLVLKWSSVQDPVLSARLLRRFAGNGIAAERIVLEAAEDHRTLLAAYGRIDVALDPRPFTGALTTCEALWMGVPVVTWPGDRVVSRQTHAILARIGQSALSAKDAAAYVAIAAELAADAERRRGLRTGLRAAMRVSPLCNPATFVTGLEQVYRDLWRQRCARA